MTSRIILGLLFSMALYSCKEKEPQVTGADSAADSPAVESTIEESGIDDSEVIDLTEEVDLYVVVAGAYSLESGALSKIEELNALGHEYAEVFQRPGSNLYSALVDRFDNESDAKAFSNQLQSDHDIKSYVYHIE